MTWKLESLRLSDNRDDLRHARQRCAQLNAVERMHFVQIRRKDDLIPAVETQPSFVPFFNWTGTRAVYLAEATGIAYSRSMRLPRPWSRCSTPSEFFDLGGDRALAAMPRAHNAHIFHGSFGRTLLAEHVAKG